MNKLPAPTVLGGEGLLRLDYVSAEDLSPALCMVAADFPGRFTDGPEGRPVSFRRQAGGADSFHIDMENDRTVIHYTSTPCALRALAAIMGDVLIGRSLSTLKESTAFTSRGAMVDTSRNGTPLISTLEYLIRRLALMGLNRLYLYCEDTIKIAGEPFLGYFRGGYTHDELKALDDYATLFGIEIIPCIQVLGHMEQALQWPAYWPLRDTSRVLIADEPATYEFLTRLIEAASAPFRSHRIHIGMDEAHGIGSGVYRQRHGQQRPFDILASHLQKVSQICKQRGLEPMIWSDMFFRLGSRSNSYYDIASRIPGDVARHIPESVSLVYWDYYHSREEFYEEWISRHCELGQTPIFATGVWTWNRFWTQLPHSFATIAPGMIAARRAQIADVFATMWGDDGSECDLLSALPGLEFFAGECFQSDEESLPGRFRGSCDSDWEAWCSASNLDHIAPEITEGEATNLSKLLLWHDPLLGFLEKHIPSGLSANYAEQKAAYESAAALPGQNTRLGHPALLAHVLSLKARLHETLRPAYHRRDRKALQEIADQLVPDLISALAKLHSSHRSLWHEIFQPFGWDVLDRRYGGLQARLNSLKLRLRDFLHNDIPIPELSLEPLSVTPPEQWGDFIVSHARAASPSAIA